MRIFNVIKRIAVGALACVLMAGSLAGCGKAKNPNTADILASLKSAVEFPEMSEVAQADVGFHIPLNADDMDQMSFIIAGSGITADEVIIVKMKEGVDMNTVKSQFESRKENQATLFEPYAPDEMPKINEAVIEVIGQYAIFAVTNDNAETRRIFKEAV